MQNLFHRIHEWATRKPVGRFDDPVLGELVLNESSWQCSVDTRVGLIIMSVGGHNQPDERILDTARETVRHIDKFINRVADYLAWESKKEVWRPFADEINSLVIADVNYWWPRDPGAGMIFFKGPDECKLWHCDIDGSRFCGLTFDS
ncbi:MAG: hypothetical protein KDA86_18850 [Planctomycetaceae bacterium]|nr:hypothetical protein [Planctomycetaceae bacterium]MCA9112313.1 hypothetical protein [Planctomycetaceae bacterium]